MVRDSLAEVKVGLFVLLALVVLVAGSLWVAGSAFVAGRRVSYEVLMADSGGIQSGDRVRIAGVSVGRIRQVELRDDGSDWPVRLEVGIRPQVVIRGDASARVATTGFLGAAYLQLEPGSADAPRLEPGGRIHGEETPGLERALMQLEEISDKLIGILDQTGGILDQVSDDVGPLFGRLERLLSEENTENATELLATLRRTVDEAAPHLNGLLVRLDAIAVQLDAGVQELPELTRDVSDLVDDLRTAVGPDGARLVRVLQATEGSLGSAEDVLSVLGNNRTELELALSDLRETIANLKSFSHQIKQRPFSLVRIKPEPDRRPGQGVEGTGR